MMNTKVYMAQWRAKHKDYMREYLKKWRLEHKEYSKEYLRKWWIKYKAERNKTRMIKRHQLGISKIYRDEFLKTPEEKKARRQITNRLWRKANPLRAKGNPLKRRYRRKLYKYNKKKAGLLTIKTIQKVYEDNIKVFGTLTCIYCLEPIQFGKDHLEHIIPLTRSGTNKFENLAIACEFCNISKGNKLLEEWGGGMRDG